MPFSDPARSASPTGSGSLARHLHVVEGDDAPREPAAASITRFIGEGLEWLDRWDRDAEVMESPARELIQGYCQSRARVIRRELRSAF